MIGLADSCQASSIDSLPVGLFERQREDWRHCTYVQYIEIMLFKYPAPIQHVRGFTVPKKKTRQTEAGLKNVRSTIRLPQHLSLNREFNVYWACGVSHPEKKPAARRAINVLKGAIEY